MACVGGARALRNLVSQTRSSLRQLTAGSICETRLGNACRSVPLAQHSTCSVDTMLGNRRLSSYFSRLPVELAGAQSLLPLHSVIATARLVSRLSTTAGDAPALLHGEGNGSKASAAEGQATFAMEPVPVP